MKPTIGRRIPSGLILLILVALLSITFSACSKDAAVTSHNELVPPPTGDSPGKPPSPTTLSTSNALLESRLQEAETGIRQLQSENQRLLAESSRLRSGNERLSTENAQLRTDVSKLKGVLDNLDSLVASATYAGTVGNLGELRSNSSQLTLFVLGLPHLPPLPAGVTVSQVNDAVSKARDLRRVIESLPKLPPSGWPPFIPFPQALIDLEAKRQTFIGLTAWVNDLQDLPTFLSTAQDLEGLRARVESYLAGVEKTAGDARDMLEQVRVSTAAR